MAFRCHAKVRLSPWRQHGLVIDFSLHQFAKSYGMVNRNRFRCGWCRGTQFGTVRYSVVSQWVENSENLIKSMGQRREATDQRLWRRTYVSY